ncbi:MAG TPA: glycosyltransferase family 87 protein [Tepidisphaeraceae bacterium]|nr:glycosyltransferase family 87 protein [Tepidisphaeraceae bacterium]
MNPQHPSDPGSPATIGSSDAPRPAGMDEPHALFGRPYTVITIVVLIAMGIGATLKKSSEWNEVPLEAAKLLLQGHDVYKDLSGYTYPPFTAFVTIPFTVLPPTAARFIWYLVCAAALVYTVRKSWQLAGGPKLEPIGASGTAAPRDHWAFLIGHAVALQLALNGVTHLQSDTLIAALLMAGCGAMVSGKYFRAATWIGLATAFKATPLLFAPYLMWRRQWLAATWLVCVAVGANLLPNLVHAPPSNRTWLGEWSSRYLAPMGDSNYMPGDWKNQLVNNQAIAGAVKRWLATTWQSGPHEFKVFDRADKASPATIRRAFYASCLAVTVPVAIVFFFRRWRKTPGGRRADRGSRGSAKELEPGPIRGTETLPSALMLECGIVMLLMLLLSPNSSRAHYCILFLPAFCAARLAVRRPKGAVAILLGLAVIFSTLSIHIRLPGTMAGEQILLWIGVVMFSTIFLLWACTLALLKSPVDDEQA